MFRGLAVLVVFVVFVVPIVQMSDTIVSITKINGYRILEPCQHPWTLHNPLWHFRNTPGHCETLLEIAQHWKKSFADSDVIQNTDWGRLWPWTLHNIQYCAIRQSSSVFQTEWHRRRGLLLWILPLTFNRLPCFLRILAIQVLDIKTWHDVW